MAENKRIASNDDVEWQMEQAWSEYEKANEDRIQREINLAWSEYYSSEAKVNRDDTEEANYAINEYMKPNDDEYDSLFNKKAATRRKATFYAKKRLLKKSEVAKNSWKKTITEFRAHEDYAVRMRKAYLLIKKAGKLKK